MLKRLCVFTLLLSIQMVQGQIQRDIQTQDYQIIEVTKDVKVKELFGILDSVVNALPDSISPKVTEHVLLWHNPWIMDSLIASDYYIQKAKGVFMYNQREHIILRKGSHIHVPKSDVSLHIINRLQRVHLDINIPEFLLRIYEGDSVKHTFPVRVGQSEHKFLQMTGRVTNLRTISGNGRIVRIITNPDYYNPVTGHRYFVTTRDDGKVTRMPQIPWLETEINGVRNGQMIHPTTNPETLGRAYSNGCIGLSEADAWKVYFNARIGTPLRIRYDLFNLDEKGDTVVFPDIYKWKMK